MSTICETSLAKSPKQVRGRQQLIDDEAAIRIAHNLIGDDTIPIKIRSTALWSVNHLYATRYSNGHVFCIGDAVHRHPPSNGLGSNTSIQDSYNLAWKLALVLKGKADASLLETYNEERPPIGKQIVERANKSIEEFGPIYKALGFSEARNVEQMYAGIEARKKGTPQGAEQREQLRKAIELKNYEFNSHGVEFKHVGSGGQRTLYPLDWHWRRGMDRGGSRGLFVKDPQKNAKKSPW